MSAMRIRLRRLWRRLVPRIEREDRASLQVQLRNACDPDFDFFLLVLLSTVIATLGLIIDSPATIIGAMLVAPLMSPIIGLGLASISGDTTLLGNSISSLLRGALLSVVLAYLLTWINLSLPFVDLYPLELPREVLSRIHPSPIDLGVALAGGFAAAFALAMPNISAALPGVAIATALMPPLCTVGIGLAVGRWEVAGGALLLFVTNAVTIAFSATLVFFALGFSPRITEKSRRIGRVPRSLFISALLTMALIVPLTSYSVSFVQQAIGNREISEIVTRRVGEVNGAELTELETTWEGNTLVMEITVRTGTPMLFQDVVGLQNAVLGDLQTAGVLDPANQEQLQVTVNQILARRLDPKVPPTFTPTNTPGPSPTVTPSATPTNTSTPTPTTTASPTPTSTPTATPTTTPTPSLVRVSNTQGRGVHLRQTPGGPIIATLREGAPLTVLFGSETIDGLVYVPAVDAEGRQGWLPQIYTRQVTPTPSPTASPSAAGQPQPG